MSRKEKFKQERTRKKKYVLKRAGRFISVFFISFVVFTATLIGIILYNPYFTTLRDIFVTTAMTTMNHQYLAEIFFNDEDIKKIMENNKTPDSNENSDGSAVNPDSIGSGDIKLVNIKGSGYKGYLLVVKDPSKVFVAATDTLKKRGMLVEDLVKERNAVAGINAGGFMDDNGHGTGGIPLGMLIENGRTLNMDNTTKHNIIGFNKNNVLVLGNFTSKEIKKMAIRDAVGFKPFLVINGKPMITKGDGGWGIAPRTAIGQRTDGTVLMLVIDGRQIGSIGATLKDVQDVMLEYGAYNAANLDGGASSTMVYNGEVVNSPSSKAGPRYVPSAFIVGK
jgi:exopolysaccharide biosynthesis protein